MMTVQIIAANKSSGNRLYVQTNANISGTATRTSFEEQINPGIVIIIVSGGALAMFMR